MKRTSLPISKLQIRRSSALVVILGLAVTLAIVSAQERKPRGQSAEPDAATRDAVYEPPVPSGAESRTPDYESPHDPDVPANVVEVPSLEGVWRGENSIVKIEISDAIEGSEKGANRFQFVGTIHNIINDRVVSNFELKPSKQRSGHYEGTWKKRDDYHGRISVRVISDGKTIRGSWTTDARPTTDSDGPEFGEVEWDRVGRIVSEFVPDVPQFSKTPSIDGRVKVFTLNNSSAVECRKHLKGLHDDVEITAVPQSNSVRVVSPFESRLRAVEEDLQKFDRSQPKTNRYRKIPASSFTPSAALVDVPGAFELLETLAQHEAMADALAEEVRQLSKSKGGQNSRQVEVRRDLEETLTESLKVKFKLEQMQIKVLEEQLELLKTQVGQRQAVSKQIVARKARELIEGTSQRNRNAPGDNDAKGELVSDKQQAKESSAGVVRNLKDGGTPSTQDQADGRGAEILANEGQSLSDAVSDFNAKNAKLGRGQDQRPLTEDEVVDSIQKLERKRDIPEISRADFAAVKEIEVTRRLPEGSEIEVLTGLQPDAFTLIDQWSIRIIIPSLKRSGTITVTVRDTKIREEKIDARFVAWGKPDSAGLSIGLYLSPKKDTYQIGDRVQLRIFVRNESLQTVYGLNFANIAWPEIKDFTVIDSTGATVPVRNGHQEWSGESWVAGVSARALSPGDVHALRVPFEVGIGGDVSNKLIGRVIEVRSGQTLQIRVRVFNGNDQRAKDDPTPESGGITLKTADAPAAQTAIDPNG